MSIKAVAISSVLDIVATNFAVILFTIIWRSAGLEVDQNLSNPLGGFRIGLMLCGSLISCLAGYFSAKIAKRSEVLNGALSSVLCVAFTLMFVIRDPGSMSALTFLDFFLSPALGAFGGYLRRRQTETQSPAGVS